MPNILDPTNIVTDKNASDYVLMERSGALNRQKSQTFVRNVLNDTGHRMVDAYYSGIGDATSAIQAAINAAFADGGGKVVFGRREYVVSGALQTSIGGVNPNCQIYIPAPANYNTDRCHIELVGACPPNFSPVGLFSDTTPAITGTIIRSTISGSGTTPAVFGGKGPAGGPGDGGFCFTYATFKNMSILVPPNYGGGGPTLTGIYGKFLASLIATNVVVSINGSLFNSVLPTNDVAGIVTTGRDGEAFSHLTNVLAVGMRYGLVTGEHCVLDQAQAYGCYAGWVPFNCSAASQANRVGINWCPNSLYVPNSTILGITAGLTYFNASLFYSEGFSAGSGNWWDHLFSVSDAGNNGRGKITYHTSRVNVGPDMTLFNKNGGTGIVCTALW